MKVKRGQLINTWGIGNIIELPDDRCGLVAGMDAWQSQYKLDHEAAGTIDQDPFVVHDERLERFLDVRKFRLPPDYQEKGPYRKRRVPMYDFPLWKTCPRCGYLVKLRPGQLHHIENQYHNLQLSGEVRCPGIPYNNGCNCHGIPQNKRPRLVPVRFVAYCENGHLQDFPFDRILDHACADGSYRLLSGFRADLESMTLSCQNCGQSKSLFSYFGDPNGLGECSGRVPWLGLAETTPCNERLYPALRGSGKLYYPELLSSLYLPPRLDDSRIIELVEREWPRLRDQYDNFIDLGVEPAMAKQGVVRTTCSRFELNEHEKALLEDILAARLDNPDASVVMDHQDSVDFLKPKEFSYLIKERIDHPELRSRALACEGLGRFGIERLTRVERIRETVVLGGFSRGGMQAAVNRMNYNERLRHMRKLLSRESMDWLPATVHYGEGIFFAFLSERIRQWVSSQRVNERIGILQNNLANGIYHRMQHLATPAFIMLHTLAHLLIKRMAYISGYSCASIKERIYSLDPDDTDDGMYGVFIYTSSGDSEGSLGGLIRLSDQDRLAVLLGEALDEAAWCSADPVCIESHGQGPDGLNLAACHNCALLPETSCEFQNRLLDRVLLVGTPQDPEIGYFAKV